MRSVLDVEISCFKSYWGKIPKAVNLLTWLKSDKYVKEINHLRALSEKAERDQIKASLPAVTISGTFHPTRKEEHLVGYSGLLCIDIDKKGNEHIANFKGLKEQLFNLKNVAYAGLSASGQGFFLIIPIAFPELHKYHFLAFKKDLEKYGLQIDTAPQNVASLRGYSYDAEALFRHDAAPYQKWLEHNKPVGEKQKTLSYAFTQSTQSQIEELIAKIVEYGIDITCYEPDWFRIACAFANEFGEQGRDYFHMVSQFHPRYEPKMTDQKYDRALKGRYQSIGIGTFIKYANDYLHSNGMTT